MAVHVPLDVTEALRKFGLEVEPVFYLRTGQGRDGERGATHVVLTADSFIIFTEGPKGPDPGCVHEPVADLTSMEVLELGHNEQVVLLMAGREELGRVHMAPGDFHEAHRLEERLMELDEDAVFARRKPVGATMRVVRRKAEVARSRELPDVEQLSGRARRDRVGITVDRRQDRPSYRAGDKVTGEVRLSLREPTPVRKVLLTFVGTEETSITEEVLTEDLEEGTVTYSESRSLVRKGLYLMGDPVADELADSIGYALGLVEYPKLQGVYLLPFSFRIPRKALATFHGERASISYKVNVRVDIPLAPDLYASGELELERRYTRFEKKARDYSKKRGKLKLEVSVEEFWPLPGQVLKGTVDVENRSGRRVRGVTVKVASYEQARAGGRRRTAALDERSVFYEHHGGERNFRVRFPGPQFIKGRSFTILYRLEVTVHLVRGRDLRLKEILFAPEY